jgi:hypothetical protein
MAEELIMLTLLQIEWQRVHNFSNGFVAIAVQVKKTVAVPTTVHYDP